MRSVLFVSLFYMTDALFGIAAGLGFQQEPYSEFLIGLFGVVLFLGLLMDLVEFIIKVKSYEV